MDAARKLLQPGEEGFEESIRHPEPLRPGAYQNLIGFNRLEVTAFHSEDQQAH